MITRMRLSVAFIPILPVFFLHANKYHAEGDDFSILTLFPANIYLRLFSRVFVPSCDI